MLDTRTCWECGYTENIDCGETCNVCDTDFCSDCSLEQGFGFHDKQGGWIFVCKSCIKEYKEKGIDWLCSELDEDFDEDTFLKALKEFEQGDVRCDTNGVVVDERITLMLERVQERAARRKRNTGGVSR